MPPQEHQNRTQQINAPAVAEPTDGRLIEFDEFIDAKLRKTRSHVRSVDFATSLMLLAAGTLIYILLAAAFDHWIVTGGLGFWSRSAFLVVYLLAAGAYLTTTLVPLLVRNINPLYAAETIERSQPSLKNGLVNFLFFRDRPERLNPAIYQAVEEQAARNLAGASSDAAVDRTRLIRVGYALAGILLVAAIYALVSPKNLFRTVGRIAVPWAEIDAPTRTTIGELEPGDAQAFRGQQIEVSARIRDLPEGSPVRLIYTTADGQAVDRAIEMKPGDEGYKYVCLLPGGEATLQQDLQYRIAAGDAVTRPFRLDVVAAPTIFVESVETKYPAYTGLLAHRVERQGDVKAIEGSEITIEAVANELIHAAHVDFDCDGTLDQRMSTSGDRAKVTFKLLLQEDRRTPKHSSYQLIFTNERDQRNPQPVRHQIEVTRDVSPEIAFVAPTHDPFDVPVNGSATLEIVANDPDFALGLVKFSLAQGEKPLADKLLLSEAHRGQFVGKYRFEPSSLGLKPGDVVTYSALAEDNKSPNPNRVETAKKTLCVTAPGNRGQQDQLAQNDSEKSDRSQADDPSKGERQQGQPDGNAPDKENADGEPGQEPPQNADQKSDGDQGDGQESASQDAGNQASSRQPADEQAGDKSQSQDKQQGQSQQSQAGQEPDESKEQQQGEGNSDSKAGDQGGAGKQSKSSSSSGDKGKQQQGSQSGASGDSADQQETAVANDGSNDGDAIERILKHRDQQQSGDGKQSGEKQSGKSSPSSAQDSKNQQAGDQSTDQPREADKQSGDGGQQQQGAGKQRDSAGQNTSKQRDSQQDRSDAADKSKGGQQPDKSDADNHEQGDQSQGERQQAKSAAKRDQQGGKSTDDQAGDNASKSGQPGEQQNAKQDRSADASQKSDSNNQRGDMNSDAKEADKPAGDKQSGNEQKQPSDGKSDEQQPSDEGQGRDQAKQGQGANAKSDPMGNKKDASKDGKQSDSKGGDGEQSKGESGAGQKSTDKQGSPSAQKDSQPRDKSQTPAQDSQESKDSNQAQSPSQNEKESDSQGQEDGDRSGGGKRGGGQKANKAGTGGAGQNTAADQGAGASEQKGDGETSSRAGDDKAADGKTGKSGNERGKGSKSQEAASKDGEESPSGADSENSAKSDASPGARDGQSSAGGGTPTGGNKDGKSDDSEPAEQPYRTAPEVADKANLEYAREASDLALSHLKDELAKDQPDANLLKDLGWSRDDLQKFVSRWEQMRRDSTAPGAKGETARRELDDTLKSLGLRPRATSLKENSARDDAVRGMRESRHSSPPPEYAEQVKAYTQGTARGGK